VLRLCQVISPVPRLCVVIRNKYWVLRGRVVSPPPNLQAGGPPTVGCPRLIIQYIRSWRPSPLSATRGRAMPWWQWTHLTCLRCSRNESRIWKKKQTFWFETLMIDVLYFTVILSEYVKLIEMTQNLLNFVMIVTTLCIPLTTAYSWLSECLPAVTKTHCTMWVRN
jgi:hypothetical protein